MDTLIEIYNRLLREMKPGYQRKFYADFRMDSRVMGIVGARGVGKTTFLINYLRTEYANSSQALYVSADNLYFVEHTLIEVIDQFVKQFNGKIICIDEIHKYKDWDQTLKNIYDSYPNIRIIFSGSSSINLIRGKSDMSRRAVLKTMYGFSFREFLEIKEKKSYPVITFDKLIKNHEIFEKEISKTPKLLGLLREYLREGYYPTRLEVHTFEAYIQSLRNIVDKIIYEDVSSFYSLKTQNLEILKKIIYYFATSLPGSVNINSIAVSLNKDHTTIAYYIQILRDSGLLRFLLKDKSGHALVRNAEKIYLDNTNLLYALNDEIGQQPLTGVLRELFVISNLQIAKTHLFYADSGDVTAEGITLEIGGKTKSSRQVRNIKDGFVVKDDILIGTPSTIPLYLFGFLY